MENVEGYSWVTPGGLNDKGQVAGNGLWNNEYYAAISGSNGEGVTLLKKNAEVKSVNNKGQVLVRDIYDNRSFILGPDGSEVAEIEAIGGSDMSLVGMNDKGQVIGTFKTATGHVHSFITGADGIGMIDLDRSKVSRINNHGQIAGVFVDQHGNHAFITDLDGNKIDLGVVSSGGNNVLLNDDGVFVLNKALNCSDGRASCTMIGGLGGSMDLVELDSLLGLGEGERISSVLDINNDGQMLVLSDHNNFYLLTTGAVPEPTVHALLLIGLIGFVAGRRRKLH